jgi:heptosyltransferase II
VSSRIVVFSPNWLGDAVMALPALADFRRSFPTSVLTVAAREQLVPLFQAAPGVDEVMALRSGGGLGAALHGRQDIRAVRAAKFDVAILLPNSFQSAWGCWRAGVPERWGYRTDGRGALLTRAVPRPDTELHQSEYYQMLAAGLGAANGPRAVRLACPEGTRARGAAALRAKGIDPASMLVGLAPGAAYGQAKRWPPEQFAELIVRLGADGISTVVLGSGHDRPTGRAIERCLVACAPGGTTGTRAASWVNMMGETDLPLLMGVMSHCRSFVSNDSGAMHVAAAVGLPVTAIFGSTNERETSPLPSAPPAAQTAGAADSATPHAVVTNPVWCRPCMLRECPLDHGCMRGISASRVYEVVKGQIGRTGDQD